MKQNNQSISEFFTNIKSIWDVMDDTSPLLTCTCNLCTCSLTKKISEKQQEQRLIQLMMKLNENYSTVRGYVLMMQLMPTLSQVFRLFTQEERHKELSHINVQPESLAVAAANRHSDTKHFRGNSNVSQS